MWKCIHLTLSHVRVISLFYSFGHHSFTLSQTLSPNWAKSFDCYFWHFSKLEFAKSETEHVGFFFLYWLCKLSHWSKRTLPFLPTHAGLETLCRVWILRKIFYSTRGTNSKFYKVWHPFLTLFWDAHCSDLSLCSLSYLIIFLLFIISWFVFSGTLHMKNK